MQLSMSTWKGLTSSEKVVFLCISLIPLWWLWGWNYLFLLLASVLFINSIFSKSYNRKHSAHLLGIKIHPAVYCLAAFGIYGLINRIFFVAYDSSSSFSSIRDFTGVLDSTLSPAYILWYIQSHKVQVRLKIVAAAFSLVVASMIIMWLYIYFGLNEVEYSPHRSIFGILTGKSVEYSSGLGKANYLYPYRFTDSSFASFARYNFFFHGPEAASIVISFIAMLALDVKNKLWSYTLFISSFFLLLLTGTRSTFIAFMAFVLIRFIIKLTKYIHKKYIFLIISFLSFLVFCLPQTSIPIYDYVDSSVTAVDQYRGDSTEARGEIYRKTFSEIRESSDTNFIFGFVNPGEAIGSQALVNVGTHSMYLGTLLYRAGFMGSIIFLSFWFSLFHWLYKTRNNRPLSSFMFFGIVSLIFIVMAFEPTILPCLSIIATMRNN